ncbi:MAG: family 10 glycosylhydrolase [candidate division KSB1 bacterium]|nr:family 10 glycosylhydrolase [candidate division KSB1 bacterium]
MGTLGFLASGLPHQACANHERKTKNWAWIPADQRRPWSKWQRDFARMKQAGIDAILPEIFDSRQAYYASQHLPVGGKWLEEILPLAKSQGLEVHAWMWSMPCNIPEIHKQHPEWFVVNRQGISCLEKPAYVDYYRFLCPSRLEVHEFLQQRVRELAGYPDLDGIHLDYIRYPDVIIAEALQAKYGIVQDREYPEYDYCYCEVCREQFKAQHGIDPLELEDPSQSEPWRQFRYDRITHLVNTKLVPIARQHGKKITAAVFPNWEAVRQQWMAWDLDGFMPMLYHNFYHGDIEWIKEHTRKGVAMLPGRGPLYSGLFVPRLSPNDLGRAIRVALQGGAAGVCLFHVGAMSDDHWRVFRKAVG